MEIFYLFEKPEYDDAIKNLSSQDDRTAVIVVTSILEQSLIDAINNVLRNRDKEIEGKLMKGYGPLSSLSSKIDLGFLLGLYSKKAHAYFHRVREIRNKMAHKITNVSFNHQEIRDQCAHLPSQADVIASWRSVYISVAEQVAAAPHLTTLPQMLEVFRENYDKTVAGLVINKREGDRGKFMTYVQSRIVSLRYISKDGLNEAATLLVSKHL